MPLCKCGKTTMNTDAHCNDCKKKEVELKKAVDEERQATITLFNSLKEEIG